MNQTCVTWRRRERLSRTGALLGTLAADTWAPAPPIWRNRDWPSRQHTTSIRSVISLLI